MALSRGQGGLYENVHPNLVLVLLLVRTKVECEKGLLAELYKSSFMI